MEKIKIYSPVDGIVHSIEKISDPVFASKSLGDGVFIKPQSDTFFSPVKDGKIELITDTKHALYFSTKNYNVLMHIGIETVNLQGVPFKILKKQGENVSIGDEVIKVDWDFIESKKLEKVTPVVVELNQVKNYKINFKNEGKLVKRGELLYEIEIEDEVKIRENKVILEKRESKYKTLAFQYLNAIGGKTNQSFIHNCMTRLRFKIVNKDMVDETKIKLIELTKGINWNGDELQIIIGGEVYKVKDECQKIIDNNEIENQVVKKNKIPAKQKIMGAITAIVFPTIPVLIGTGVISGVQAILVIAGVIQNPASGQTPMDLDLISGIMFIMSKVGIELVGVVFLCSTVKFFKGDPWLAIWLALALTSRYLFGSGWGLFTLFNSEIVVKTYEGTVLPMVCAGILLVFIDRWIKTWMPTSVDIVFRPALVFISTFLIMLFSVGPFFRIIEQFIAKFVVLLGRVPFGIGMGIFAFLWQPLVLTGTHVAVVAVITLPMNQTPPIASPMYACIQLAVIAQLGAVIAVAFLTKNQKTKQAIYASIPGAIFGITEPIIYGINLPKIKPFFLGCLGAAVGGVTAGLMGVEQVRRTGTGVMSWMGFDLGWGTVFGIIANLIALGAAFGFTILIFQDRKSEYLIYKQNNLFLMKIIKKSLKFDEIHQKDAKEKLNSYLLEVKKFSKKYKEYENTLINLQKKEIRKQNIINNFELKKEKIYKNALKFDYKDLTKFNLLATKYNDLKLPEHLEKLVQEIKELEIKLKKIENEVKHFNKENYKLICDFIDSINVDKNQILDNFKIFYLKSLNSIDISYEIIPSYILDYSNREFINLKTIEEIKNEKKMVR